MQGYKEYILSNKIKVLYFNFPFMKSTEVSMFLKGGSLFESESQVGLSHFLEHILFTGTKKFPHRMDLSEAIKQTGGSINGHTSKELWHYPIKVTDGYIPLAFEALSEMLRNPLLKKEDVEKEKNIIKEELQRIVDKPSDYLGRSIMPQTIFQNVALKRPLENEIDNINFDFDLLYKHTVIAQRLMDDIVDLEIEKIDKILIKRRSIIIDRLFSYI